MPEGTVRRPRRRSALPMGPGPRQSRRSGLPEGTKDAARGDVGCLEVRHFVTPRQHVIPLSTEIADFPDFRASEYPYSVTPRQLVIPRSTKIAKSGVSGASEHENRKIWHFRCLGARESQTLAFPVPRSTEITTRTMPWAAARRATRRTCWPSANDWLFWGTLAIERERPAVYGWKQRPRERSALHRNPNRPPRLVSAFAPKASRGPHSADGSSGSARRPRRARAP